ncbi:MAG: galactose mutarotase, partial [Pedobacter sp.]
DHTYVLEDGQPAAMLYDPYSGRGLTVYTNQPGMQVYTANWWDGSITGAHGNPYIKYGAIALETQAFPDAPNHAHFPEAVLRPGNTYNRYTIFEFTAHQII